MDSELYRELRGLHADRLMTERAVSSEQNRWAELLKGSIGQDMNDVLSGKKIVKFTKREIFRYKWNYYKNKIKSIFKYNNDEQ